MKSHVAAFALLSSVVASPADLIDVKRANLQQATYCITYESTYLVPVSIGTNSSEAGSSIINEPGILSSNTATLPLLTTSQGVVTTVATEDAEQSTLPTDTATAPPSLEPSGQRVIFLVTPSGELTKRDVGGFVGNDNPDVCTFATVFTLGQGRLFNEDFPISYSGEDFQPIQSSSSPGEDGITTTFSSEGGVLGFSNSSLPGGRASFCQTPSDGRVYITYSSRPTGCIFVTLTIYAAERCINGRIDGLETSTTGLTQSESTQFTIPPFTETNFPDSPETELPDISGTDTPDSTDTPPIVKTSDGGGIVFPTMPIGPTRSWLNQTSGTSTTDQGSGVVTSADGLPSNTDLEPTSVSEEVSTSEVSFDPVTSTTLATVDKTLTTAVAESSTTILSVDFESTASDGSATTNDLDTLTTLITTLDTTKMDATTTATEATTTTQEPALVARSVARNGKFAISDPNDLEAIEGWASQGNAQQISGLCYRDDGSTDNGCVALGETVINARKRDVDSRDFIRQDLTGLQGGTYTIQFYYLVGRFLPSSGSCTLMGEAGYTEFFSWDIAVSESGMPWRKAIGTVDADVTNAPLIISLVCENGGQAVVIVDSVFASEEVTPENIDEYELDFGDEATPA